MSRENKAASKQIRQGKLQYADNSKQGKPPILQGQINDIKEVCLNVDKSYCSKVIHYEYAKATISKLYMITSSKMGQAKFYEIQFND